MVDILFITLFIILVNIIHFNHIESVVTEILYEYHELTFALNIRENTYSLNYFTQYLPKEYKKFFFSLIFSLN